MRTRFKLNPTLNTILSAVIVSSLLLMPVIARGQAEQYRGQGKDQLVDALDASIARVLDSGQFRTILNNDPVAGPLIVNIADCYPRVVDGADIVYPFPQNPTGLLASILATKQIKMGTFNVVSTPGTFHVFDNVNQLLMRAIIDELGKGYGIPPSPDLLAIQIVPVIIAAPSSVLVFAGLNNGD